MDQQADNGVTTLFSVNFDSANGETFEWSFMSDNRGTVFNVTSPTLHFLVDRFRWEPRSSYIDISVPGRRDFVAEPKVFLAYEQYLAGLITGLVGQEDL